MNAPDKPPPMNVAVVLHFDGEGGAFNPTGLLVLGYHDGVRWRADGDDVVAVRAPIGWSLIDATTPKHDPADLAKLIGLLAQHEQTFHKDKPFDLKRAIRVVEGLAEAREELWNDRLLRGDS